MTLLFRVLVAAFVCVAPTVLFLGLWHGLQRMQDDELTERIAGRHGVTIEDFVPGTQSRRTHELDSAERRSLQRMATDDALAPEERDRS